MNSSSFSTAGKAGGRALIGGKMLQELSRPFPLSVTRWKSRQHRDQRFPDDGKTLLELMNNADVAMYHAKKAGRTAICFCAGHGDSESPSRRIGRCGVGLDAMRVPFNQVVCAV